MDSIFPFLSVLIPTLSVAWFSDCLSSKAWKYYGLNLPPYDGGWIQADDRGGYTCCVEQGHYGHIARKATWLYINGIVLKYLPIIEWGKCKGKEGNYIEKISKEQRAATPIAFRDLLIEIALAVYKKR